MQKNVASQKIGAQLVSASDGSAFTGSVTVAVTGDAGTQATGSVGSGACAHEGNGYHTYAPAQAETNYDLIAFTFTGTGAVPATIQVFTRWNANTTHNAGTAITAASGRQEVNVTHNAGTAITASSGRQEVNTTHWGGTAVASATPNVNVTQISGDSTAADNAESYFDGTGYAGTNNVIPTVTNLTNAPGAGDLTATMKTSVQTAATAALNAYDPPTNAEMEARTLVAASYATVTKQDLQTTTINDIDSATAYMLPFMDIITNYCSGIDGKLNLIPLLESEITTVTNQTTLILNTGSTLDDVYNGMAIVLNDVSTGLRYINRVADYVGSTKTLTLAAAPPFTIVDADSVRILATPNLVNANMTHILDGALTDDNTDTEFGGSLAQNISIYFGQQQNVDVVSVGASATGSGGGGGGPTAGQVADAVLDELMAGHTTTGTLGKAIADILDDTSTSGVVLAPGQTFEAGPEFLADVGEAAATATRTELAVELGRIDAAMSTRASSTALATMQGNVTTINSRVTTALPNAAPGNNSGLARVTDLPEGGGGGGTPIAPITVSKLRTWRPSSLDASRAENIVTVKVPVSGTFAAEMPLNPDADISSVDAVTVTPPSGEVEATDLKKTADGRTVHFNLPTLSTAGTYGIVVTVTTLDGQEISMACSLIVR